MVWSTIKTQAIILRSTPFREVDRRYSAITPEFGKVIFTGRGARKGRAKLAAHLEPFAIVELEIVRGRRNTIVISVERQYAFRNLMSDIEQRILAQASLSLIDRHTKDLDPDQILYQGVIDWLEFLDKNLDINKAKRLYLFGAFLLRFMQQLGYEVSLDKCVACKQKILPLAFRWHGNRGGLVCSDCIQKDEQEWFAARKIDEEVIKILRFAREGDYQDLIKLSMSSGDIESFAQIVHDLMQYHLPVETYVPFWEAT